MRMNIKERKELAFSKVLIIVVAVVGLSVVVWLAWVRPAQKAANVSNFAECVEAGNAVQTSYPETCVAPNGQRFTNPEQPAEDPVTAKMKITKSPLSQTFEALRAIVLAETQKQAPGCIQNGALADKNKQAINPTVTYQASGYAVVAIGCDSAAKPTLFGQDKEGKWQVVQVSQGGLFSCEVLAGTDTIKEFFETATGSGVCLDQATGQQLDISTLHM